MQKLETNVYVNRLDFSDDGRQLITGIDKFDLVSTTQQKSATYRDLSESPGYDGKMDQVGRRKSGLATA